MQQVKIPVCRLYAGEYYSVSQLYSLWSEGYRRALPWCKFDSEAGPNLHCHGCGTHHDVQAFPPYTTTTEGGRQCLGRQGGMQLCEHVHIYWADIEHHITYWRKRMPRITGVTAWIVFMSSVATRALSRTPYQPQETGRKHASRPNGGLMRCFFAWSRKPTAASLDPLLSAPMDVHGCRPQSWGPYSEGTGRERGGILLPSRAAATYLPEMTCFPRNRCGCVRYEDINGPAPTYDLSWEAFFKGYCRDWDWLTRCCDALHSQWFGGKGDGSTVGMRRHGDVGTSVCLVTTYQCNVPV